MGVQVADNSDATLQSLLRNPDVNSTFGRAYFEAMKKQNGGNEALAAAAYNAGPGAVQQAGGIPNIPETQAYVQKLGLGTGEQVQPTASQQPTQAAQTAQAGPDPQRLLAIINDPAFQHVDPMQQKMIVDAYQKATAVPDPMDATRTRRWRNSRRTSSWRWSPWNS